MPSQYGTFISLFEKPLSVLLKHWALCSRDRWIITARSVWHATVIHGANFTARLLEAASRRRSQSHRNIAVPITGGHDGRKTVGDRVKQIPVSNHRDRIQNWTVGLVTRWYWIINCWVSGHWNHETNVNNYDIGWTWLDTWMLSLSSHTSQSVTLLVPHGKMAAGLVLIALPELILLISVYISVISNPVTKKIHRLVVTLLRQHLWLVMSCVWAQYSTLTFNTCRPDARGKP